MVENAVYQKKFQLWRNLKERVKQGLYAEISTVYICHRKPFFVLGIFSVPLTCQ